MSRLCPFPLLNCKNDNVWIVGAAVGIQSNSESRNWQKLGASGLSPASKPKACSCRIQILEWWISPSGKSPLHQRKVVRRYTQRCIPVQEWWVTHKCTWKSFSSHFFWIHRAIISLRINHLTASTLCCSGVHAAVVFEDWVFPQESYFLSCS